MLYFHINQIMCWHEYCLSSILAFVLLLLLTIKHVGYGGVMCILFSDCNLSKIKVPTS